MLGSSEQESRSNVAEDVFAFLHLCVCVCEFKFACMDFWVESTRGSCGVCQPS